MQYFLGHSPEAEVFSPLLTRVAAVLPEERSVDVFQSAVLQERSARQDSDFIMCSGVRKL
jgi:hypothetical protein